MKCLFCDEFIDFKSSHFADNVDWPWPNRIVYENETMYVVPGFYPQVFPYLLVVSKRHFSSLFEATLLERKGVTDTLTWIWTHPASMKRDLQIFEHANHTGVNSCEKCVDHFHLHCVNMGSEIVDEFRKHHDYFSETISNPPPAKHYLLAGEFFGKDLAYYARLVTNESESQYFRRRIAEKLGAKEWFWQLGLNEELTREIYIAYTTCE